MLLLQKKQAVTDISDIIKETGNELSGCVSIRLVYIRKCLVLCMREIENRKTGEWREKVWK